MKLYILLLILAFPAIADTRLAIEFPVSQVAQGELVKGTLRVAPDAVNLPLGKLTGTNFGDVLYIHELSPLVRREGAGVYEAEVTIIFASVPEQNSIAGKLGDTPVTFTWSSLTVTPTELPQGMLWAEFSAPDFVEKNWLWLIALPGVLLIGLAGFMAWKRWEKKRRRRESRQKLADELSRCGNYEDVVKLWKRKREFLKEFPDLEEDFVSLEATLFKVQFKPVQSDAERSLVVSAYAKFLESAQGRLRGI